MNLRYSPFGGKALDKVAADDIREVVVNEIREGVFVEYKSDWSPEKVARAVASFANNDGGGTVVVGVASKGLLPVDASGFQVAGDAAEMAVQAIRSNVDPVPDFRVHAVEMGSGKVALVIEVPEGTDPPYIYVKKGQVLVRTPTSSEPILENDRSHLDRLFSRGQRGREWAAQKAVALPLYKEPALIDINLWTIPTSAGGLGVNDIIFRESFLDGVSRLMPVPFAHMETNVVYLPLQDRAGVRKTFIYEASTFVSVEGTVQTRWLPVGGEGEELPPYDLPAIGRFLREAIVANCTITEELLGHRGNFALAFDGRVGGGRNGSDYVHVVRSFVSAPVDIDSLVGSMVREVKRAIGMPEFEPEA